MTRARHGLLVTAALLVAGWLAPVPAGADATGKWRFEEAGTSPAFVDIAQSGSAISFAYEGESFAGSVSGSGDFTADAAPSPSLPCGADMTGHILSSAKTQNDPAHGRFRARGGS